MNKLMWFRLHMDRNYWNESLIKGKLHPIHESKYPSFFYLKKKAYIVELGIELYWFRDRDQVVAPGQSPPPSDRPSFPGSPYH